jgi:5-hydroxyisourate hydrolase
LYRAEKEEWIEIGRSRTNADGRIPDLLSEEMTLDKCICKLRFETKDYFDNNQIPSFYPIVEIAFNVEPAEHFHVPLLLNPFGYSTYRGS